MAGRMAGLSPSRGGKAANTEVLAKDCPMLPTLLTALALSLGQTPPSQPAANAAPTWMFDDAPRRRWSTSCEGESAGIAAICCDQGFRVTIMQ